MPLYFPCTVEINDEQIFVFGQKYSKLSQESSLHAFIVNSRTRKYSYIPLLGNFSCSTHMTTLTKFTCANLRSHNFVLVAIPGNCTAALNLHSLTWTSLIQPVNNGIIFNGDVSRESAILIGNFGTNDSELYEVHYNIFCHR